MPERAGRGVLVPLPVRPQVRGARTADRAGGARMSQAPHEDEPTTDRPKNPVVDPDTAPDGGSDDPDRFDAG